jgi:hypothetical protein
MMTASHAQPSLFDSDQFVDREQAEFARARMRGAIDLLAATSYPPWKDQMAVILEEGSFRRAMRLVPDDEAQRLWSEFDRQMDRLCAMWGEDTAEPQG